MITAKAFAGKHYAVLGLARSGLATVEALLASGARVTAWDDDETARSSVQAKLVGRGTAAEGSGGGVSANPSTIESSFDGPPPHASHREELTLTDFTASDLTQFDSIVVTPGLPLNRHPIALRARDANVEIIGDIELFARARPELPPHKVVGITGTNGKSTTTALVHHILTTAGVPATMGGNIGLPILAQDPLPEGGVYVLELSSFQIDLTKSLGCDVAVLLNITPDHLDRYESFEAYGASKRRLFQMQLPGGHMVVDSIADVKFCLSHDTPNQSRAYVEDVEDDYYFEFIDQQDYPALQGPHNSQNTAAAFEVCRFLGLNFEQIRVGLRTYPGLPHRMERILDRNGVLYVNDSKATNAEAAAPALAAYPRVRWIVGGQAKAETLGDTAKHLDHVVKAYAIGEAGAMFARLLREVKVDVIEAGTLDKAVALAAQEAVPGETVLLSPAAASFDQFRDFEDRGDQFRDLVRAL